MNIEKKRDFVEALRRQLPEGTTIAESEKVVEAVAAAVKDAFASGAEVVSIPGVVKMQRKEVAARVGRNPKTGVTVEIAAHTAVKAKPAAAISALVQGGA